MPEEDKKEAGDEPTSEEGSEESGPAANEEEITEEETAAEEHEKGEAEPVTAAPAPKRSMAMPKLKFLETRRGKLIALLLVLVIVGAAGAALTFRVERTVEFNVSFDFENLTVPDDFYTEETLNFAYGHRRAPVSTSATVSFPVEANATGGKVETEGDPGSVRRWDGGDRKEVDIEVKGANGKTMGVSATPEMNEMVELTAAQMEKGGVGDWTVVVDCYSGTDVTVTVKIWVTYGGIKNDTGNETQNTTIPNKAPAQVFNENNEGSGPSMMERESRASEFK